MHGRAWSGASEFPTGEVAPARTIACVVTPYQQRHDAPGRVPDRDEQPGLASEGQVAPAVAPPADDPGHAQHSVADALAQVAGNAGAALASEGAVIAAA